MSEGSTPSVPVTSSEGNLAEGRAPVGSRLAVPAVRFDSAPFFHTEGAGRCWPTWLEPRGARKRRGWTPPPSSTFSLTGLDRPPTLLPSGSTQFNVRPLRHRDAQPPDPSGRCGDVHQARRPQGRRLHVVGLFTPTPEAPAPERKSGLRRLGAKLKRTSAGLRNRMLEVRVLPSPPPMPTLPRGKGRPAH